MTDTMFYDSLHDPNLQTYFENKNVQKHLRKIGFINRHGEIVPEKEFQLNVQQRQKQRQIRAMLSQGIAEKIIQLEKTRQANVKNQFELTKKLISVENIRDSKQKPKTFARKDLISLDQADYFEFPLPEVKSKKEPRRLKSRQSSRNKTRPKSSNVHSNENNKDFIEITMVYLANHSAEIMILQQHCGAQNICVFKNNLKPNDEFTFKSRRQNSFPFALTLYIDGIIDSRISVCCEYKHKLNVPLGSKSASFAIVNVEGGRPCQTCRFNEYLSTKNQISLTNETTEDEQTTTTTVSIRQETSCKSPSDEIEEATKVYLQMSNELDENVLNKENGYLHYQLGNICKEGLNDYDRALEHYLSSLEIFLLFYLPTNCQLRNLYLNISHLFILKNETLLAIEYLKRILDIDYSFQYINYFNLINIHNYLALLYLKQSKYHKCVYHLSKCLRFYSNVNLNSNKTHRNRNRNLFVSQTKYDDKALKCLSIDEIPRLSQLHFSLSIVYDKLNDQLNAFKHIEQAIQLEQHDQHQRTLFQNHFQRMKNKFRN